MQKKNVNKREEKPNPDLEWGCDRGRALEALAALETGVRQRFLNDEASIEHTKATLDCIKEANKQCEAGDVSACEVLANLVGELTQNTSETESAP